MEDLSISLMSPAGYLLCYHRENNKLVITLPQTESTMMTTGEISHRRTNLMTSELDYILRMVQCVFEGEYLDAPPEKAEKGAQKLARELIDMDCSHRRKER